MTTTTKRHTHTPWGTPQDITTLERGIFRVETSGHGGYFAPADVMKDWPLDLRTAHTYGGVGWFEEDCDWAILAMAEPDLLNADGTRHFTDLTLEMAMRTITSAAQRNNDGWQARFLKSLRRTEIDKRLAAARAEWEEKDCYILGCMGTSAKHREWDASFWPMYGNGLGVRVINISSRNMPGGAVPLNDLLNLPALGKCQYVDRLPPR
jgi:hypothetical protein